MCCFTKNNFANDNDSTKANIKSSVNTKIFDRAEVMPGFPGGNDSLMKYIYKNIIYPSDSRFNGVEGKVIIKFYVDTFGNVRNPISLKQVDFRLIAAAQKVLINMPKWSPAMQDGEKVNCYIILPITFKIAK
jgi:hypothetical protein